MRINSTQGYGIAISSVDMLNAILNTDYESIRRICEIWSDENIIKVIRAIDFTEFRNEKEIIKISGLSSEDVQVALFKVLN